MTLLDGAPDGRTYRRFSGPSREQAEHAARAFAQQPSAAALVPVARRWDEQAGVLSVAYAPLSGAPSRRRRPGRAVALGAVVVAILAVALASTGALPPRQSVPVVADAQPTPLASATPPSIADSYSGPLPHFVEGECRGYWLEGRRTDCGDLIVPEDRADPDSRRISLHVAIHRAFSRNPRPDPVVYLDGGPGASPLLDGIVAYPFVHDRDLIVFDQRGTGLSQPSLDCPEVVFLFLREEIDALRACRARLVRDGVRLAAYNSAASAADLADLRRVLGYDEWNLYGISYGTRLALTAMRDHPVGIRSVVLDAVYPPQHDVYEDGAVNAQRAIDKLFAACAADSSCGETFPDLEPRFYQLVERLDERPRKIGDLLGFGGTHVDGSTLVRLLFYRLYITEVLGELPLTLDNFWNDEWDELEFWLWDLASFGRSAGLQSISEGFHYSVQCADELPFSNRARLARADPGVYESVAIAFDWQVMLDICAMWDVPASDGIEARPVASDIPTLLLSGSYDPITPPAWADSAAATLGAAQRFVFPGVGHGAIGTSYCVDDLVADFLDEPLTALDGSCIDELGEPEFRTAPWSDFDWPE